jgi:hypothetical protein
MELGPCAILRDPAPSADIDAAWSASHPTSSSGIFHFAVGRVTKGVSFP